MFTINETHSRERVRNIRGNARDSFRRAELSLRGALTAHSRRWDPTWRTQQEAAFWEAAIDEN